MQNQPKISDGFQSNRNLKERTMKAEIAIAAFFVEHNIAFSGMNHFVDLVKNIAPDSKILKEIKCARTKGTAFAKNVIRLTMENILNNLLRNHKFSLCIDESTDMSTKKLLSLVVRVSSEDFRIRDYFFGLIKVSEADASSLYEVITYLFRKKNINYKENLIGFAADGASVMHGRTHSVAALLKKQTAQTYF